MKDPIYTSSELHSIESTLNDIFKGVMSFSLSLLKPKAAQLAASKLRENPAYNKPLGIFYSNLMDDRGFVPLSTASIAQLWKNETYSATLRSNWKDPFDFLCACAEAGKKYSTQKTERNIRKSADSSNATSAIVDSKERKTKEYPLYSNWSSVVENITEVDDAFLYSHLRKDAVNNLYWKWDDGSISMVPISEVSKGRQIVDDDEFWTRFMNDNAAKLKSYCQTILEKAYELQSDSTFDEDTVIESLESRIEPLVPHCISRQLSVQITYVKEGRGKDVNWLFEKFSLSMTGIKPALNRDNWCSVLQLNLLKFLDSSRIGKIKQWHTKFAENDNVDSMYSLDACGIPVGEKVVQMPRLPGPFADFFNGKLVNPIMDLLRIATFITTALDDDDKSRQALFLVGKGKDGKGCFSRFIEHIFGPAFETINEENFTNRFGLETAINKRVICVQDASDPTSIVESATFKSLTGGDPLFVDIKYRKPVCWHTEGTKVVVTTNKFLWLNDEYSISRVLPVFFQRNYDPLDIKSVDDIGAELCANSKEFIHWCYRYVSYFKQRKSKGGKPWKMNTKNGLILLSDRQYKLWMEDKLNGSWGDIQREAFAEATPKNSADDYFRVARFAEAIEDIEQIYRLIADNYLFFSPGLSVTRAEINIALRKAAYRGNSFELQAVGIDRYSKDCNKSIRGFIKWLCAQDGVTTSTDESGKRIEGVRLKEISDTVITDKKFPTIQEAGVCDLMF